MTQRTPEPGLVLAGRYKLETKLGEGGMGTVWRAEHLVLCAPVAVKILDRDVSKDEEAHDRFIREARSAATLRSPHVVQTLDYGIDQGMPFIAMELLEGETLQHRLARMGKLSPGDTARIINHVARAVARAHEAGIIHRDLKPENVFLVKNEDAEIAKVLDFGVAKVETASLGPKGSRTRTGSLLGTPFYMSPEQAQGNKTIDHRSDLWALAVIAFECITGKRPFESDGLGDLVLQICVHPVPKPSKYLPITQKLEDWFAKAMARDPDLRFQSARELAETMREAIGGEGRETMSTLSDYEDLPPAPISPIIIDVEDDEPLVGSAKTVVSTPATVTPAPRPSLTIQQFGTTQATSPPPRKGIGLLLFVCIVFLAIGVVGGFVVLNPQSLASLGLGGDTPSGTATPTPPPSAEPADAGANAVDAGGQSIDDDPSVPSPAQGPTDASSSSTDVKTTEITDASGKAGDPKTGPDKGDKKKDAGFVIKNPDWGLTEDDPRHDPLLDKPIPPAPDI